MTVTEEGNRINMHLGKRLRLRRRMLCMTQHQLAEKVGIRFQQVQKYECGANQISAARLWQLIDALEVDVSYFFDGLARAAPEAEGNRDAINLLSAVEKLNPTARKRLLSFITSLTDEG